MANLENPEALSVLIADDCPITRRILTHYLKKLGHHVDATENGEECLAAALVNSYDVLISDLDMPKMNGIECAICIRQVGNLVPIIALTANYCDRVREHCFQAGMNAFMTKPLNFLELKRHLDEIALRKPATPFAV